MTNMLSHKKLLKKIADLEKRNQELERFAVSFQNALDAMSLNDFEGRFLEVNDALCHGLGYSKEELLQMRGIDLKPECQHEQFKNSLARLKLEGQLTIETSYRRKDGSIFPVELSATVVQYHLDSFILIVARDITARKQRENNLRRFSEFFSLSQDLIAYVDSNYTYQIVNEQFCLDNGKPHEKIVGHTVAEVLGKNVFTDIVKPKLDRCFDGEIVRFQKWFEYGPACRRFRDVSYYPDRHKDGSIVGIFAVIHDLTDLKQAQDEKEADQALLSHVLDNISGGVYLINQSYEILYANQHLVKERGQVNGRRCYDYIAYQKRPCPWCRNATIFSTGEPLHWMHHSTPNNRIYDVFETMVKKTGFESVKITFFHDITNSKHYEQELRDKRQLLDSIVNNSSAIIYVKDRSGRYILTNSQFEEQFCSAEKINEKTDFDIFNEKYAKQFNKNDQTVLSSGKVNIFEEQLFFEDTLRSYISIKFPLFDEQHVPYAVGGITTDITERKKMELALRDQNEQLLSLINASPDIICFKDGAGRWLLANEADLRLFELEGVDYTGKTDAELADYSSFYREAFLACWKSDEIAWKKQTLSRGTELIPRPDGSLSTYDIIKVPLFQSDGTRKGLVVIGRDVSWSVQARTELEEKNKKIRETNIALRVLVDQQQEMCHNQEQQIMTTLRRLVFPYIENLASCEMEERACDLVQLITAHLNSLGASFCKSLDNPSIGLTPRELLVADLVRQGKRSSNIANLLGLTERTVEVYRNSIRKKLKISGKQINLHKYLKKKFTSTF